MNTEQKLIDLESTVGLLQHDIDRQNDALLELTRRCDELQRVLGRMAEKIDLLEQREDTLPPDERPPHY